MKKHFLEVTKILQRNSVWIDSFRIHFYQLFIVEHLLRVAEIVKQTLLALIHVWYSFLPKLYGKFPS